jgi:hypothetical protein
MPGVIVSNTIVKGGEGVRNVGAAHPIALAADDAPKIAD